MVEKLELSDNAKYVVQELRQKRKELYNDINIRDELRSHLNKSDNFREEKFIMSNAGLVLITNYVGRPVHDVLNLIKSPKYMNDVGNIFEEPLKFSKFIFDIIYGLASMNKMYNIIHGDLHLNNVTIHHPRSLGETDDTYVEFFNVDKALYQFNDYNIMGKIIDFSRAMILPNTHKPTMAREKITNKIINHYALLFPDFYSVNKQNIKLLLLSSFKKVYRLFTAIDSYIFINNMLTFTTQIKTHPKCITLLKSIIKQCNMYLINKMSELIKSPSIQINYPNVEILHACFKPFKVKKLKTINFKISSIVSLNNQSIYSLYSIDNLHPIIKSVFTFPKIKMGDRIIGVDIKNKFKQWQSLNFIKYNTLGQVHIGESKTLEERFEERNKDLKLLLHNFKFE